MSIVADNMFIFPLKNLPAFVKFCENKMYEAMLDHFKSHSSLLNYLNNHYNEEIEAEFQAKVTKTMQSPHFTPDEEYELECGLSIWLWNDKVVVKPYGLSKFKYSEWPRYVKDFSYWNNCDKPDDVDGREWGRRSRFFGTTIDSIPRVEYHAFDFLSKYRMRSIVNLSSYQRRMQEAKR